MNKKDNPWEYETSTSEEVFDGEDDISHEELLKDGTDYTDIVEKYKNRRRNVIIILISLAVILGIGIFFGSKYILENPEVEKTEPTSQVSEPTQEEIPSLSPDYTEPANPVSSLFPDRPEITKEEITTFAESDMLQTSHGTLITVSNAENIPTVHECSVRNATDFCNAATVKFNNLDYHAYFLKDAVGSRFFEEAKDFQETEVNGAKASATLTIDTLDGTSTPVLVVIEQDGTGFMFTASDNNLTSLTSLAEAITVN